jgi:penicillin-binding protein 1A
MTSMMRDVVQLGTARKARVLGRGDLAGKTGTTNDQRDAWFNGFNEHLVANVWVGFDDNSKLGRREVGGKAALPAWMDFMRAALKDVPDKEPTMPQNIVTMRIDPSTGAPATAGTDGAIYEVFRAENTPGSNGSFGGGENGGAMAPGVAPQTQDLF